MFEDRRYREHMGSRLRSFSVSFKATDLWIGVEPETYVPEMEGFILNEIEKLWTELEEYIQEHPDYKKSLEPIEPTEDMTPLVKWMAKVTHKVGLGPMAAVAGAYSQTIGMALREKYGPTDIVVENGGDIWMLASEEVSVSVFAGDSPISEKVGFKVPAEFTPIGICTSSGTVGPSLSFGKADAIAIISPDTALADAYATFYCNKVQEPADIENVMKEISAQEDIVGAMGIMADQVGILGIFELALFSPEA